jgi:argininosuccinate lyase
LEYAKKISELTRGVVATLTVNEKRLWEVLESGFSQATDLAEHLMLACGIDYRTAYRIVGDAVRTASRNGLRGIDIEVRALEEAAQRIGGVAISLDPGDLAAALDPRAIVAGRSSLGGAAPDMVAALAEKNIAIARQHAVQANEQLARFDRVEKELTVRVERFLAGGSL